MSLTDITPAALDAIDAPTVTPACVAAATTEAVAIPAAATPTDDWRALLQAEIERTSIAEVARRVGCARTALSMVLRDKYPANPDRIIARVRELLTRVACPYLGRDITPADCRSHAHDAPSMSSTVTADHWRACQRCERRPAPTHAHAVPTPKEV